MTVRRESVATIGGDTIEAVVDLAGRALVHDGVTYRDPARARQVAHAILRAAKRAEQLARESHDASGVLPIPTKDARAVSARRATR